jgi:hypothetical protein
MGVSPKSDRAHGVPAAYQILESELSSDGVEAVS